MSVRIGEPVVAIKSRTFNEIVIYGMGEVIDKVADDYIVAVEEGNIFRCSEVCPMDEWVDLVDETGAKVRRTRSKPRKIQYKV